MERRSSLDRLLDGLLRAPHDYRATINFFPDLDPGKLAKELKLEERGKERATRKEPLRAAGQLDDIESAIIEHVESEKTHAHQILEEQLQSYAHRLGSLDFQGRFTAIHQTAPDCIAEFRAELAKGTDELHERRRSLLDHEKEWHRFRKEHGLERPARTHSDAVAFMKWGFLVLLLTFEASLNGSFLAAGSETGYVGGISAALAFAALNVGGAFAAAVLGARLTIHRNALLKMVGVLAVIAWVCFTLALNLALAHYREVAQALVEEPGREVIARLRDSPFMLNDIQSWALFGIGLLFALAAFADSLLLFDPYWGYGSLDKRLRKSTARYRNLKAHLVDELKEIHEDFSAKLGSISDDLGKRLGEYDRIIAAKKGRIDLFHAHQTQLEKGANALLGTYRAARGLANEAPYKLARINVSADNPDRKKREEIERTVKEAQAVLRTQLDTLHREFREGLARYDQIDDLVGDGRDRHG